MKFPITEAEFSAWLALEPNKKAGIINQVDPISAAIKEIVPDVGAFIGDDDWCFDSDMVYGGEQNRPLPKWVLKVDAVVNALGTWEVRRGKLLEALNA